MHEALRVRRVQRSRDRRQQRQRPRRLEHALVAEHLPQVRALDEAHGDEQPALGLPGLVDGNHVRVVEARRETGFV